MPNDVINTITINNNTYDIGGTGCGKAINMTLSANSWDANNRQSLQFSGYRSGQSGVIGMPTSVTSAQKSAYQNADISIYSQSSDTFTFECGGTVPSIDLPVSLFITDLGGGSGGSGGHTIEDADGTDMTQRTNLQFLDAGVTDDSTDDVTKIENVQVIDDEDDLEDAPDGIYMGDWDDADAVIDASIVGYDNTDSGLEATDVQGAVDELASNKVDAVQGKGLSTNDYDNTDKAKVGKIDETTTHVSGNPISITGLKSNQLAVNPIITLEPIQAGSGTPSPSNIRAISGYDKIEVLSCGRGELQNDTNGARNASTGAIYDTSIRVTTANFIKVKANEKYFIHIEKTSSAVQDKDITFSYAFWYNNSTTTNSRLYDSGWTGVTDLFVSYSTDTYLNVVAKYTDDSTIDASHVNIYVTSYKTTDLSESLGQTVYGGSLDVRTGKLIVTHQIADMGDLNWSYDMQYQRFLAVAPNINQKGARVLPFVCSCYECISDGREVYDVPNYAIYSSGSYLYIHDSRYTDATTFKTTVTGQKVAYPLDTPTEIQLTPHEISLLKDYAYVSTNGTSIAFDYHNGELASLADVSQIGNTLNNLGSFLSDNKFNIGIGLPSGNVNLSIIQANFKSPGIAMHYIAESDWEGWSTIIGILNSATVRSFIIISRRRIIYSYTTNNGTSWTTQTLVTAT